MNKFLFFIVGLFINFIGTAQFCSTGSLNNQGALSVTETAQTTPVINANGTRLYYTFDVEPGCIYTFETCGLTTIDTYIRIYGGTNPASAPLLFQNDQGCGNQSRVSFQVTAAATYSILITRVRCTATFFGLCVAYDDCSTLNNNNISVSYVKDCTHTNQECFGATQICNDISFTGDSADFGQWQELNSSNRGCLADNEHQSSWYYFIPTVNGTISMTIQTTVDYDFAIWQGTNCANLGAPIRCSFSAIEGNTGLGNGATDNSEGSGGNAWVAPLNVTAGTFYIMVIDNYDADNTSFTIDFTFSSPDLLNCNPIPLPISLYSFSGENIENENVLNWLTLSEVNNDKFIIEHSFDLKSWNVLGEVKGSGYGDMYEFKHVNYRYTLNYYRLSQVDFDGSKTVFEPIVIDNTSNKKIVKVYNILGQEVDIDSGGLRIILYDDGTILKLF